MWPSEFSRCRDMEEFRICSEEKMLSWWLRRGRKLDVGRPGRKGVEELLICGLYTRAVQASDHDRVY